MENVKRQDTIVKLGKWDEFRDRRLVTMRNFVAARKKSILVTKII
jgi:hypothetical protein